MGNCIGNSHYPSAAVYSDIGSDNILLPALHDKLHCGILVEHGQLYSSSLEGRASPAAARLS